MFPGIVFPPHYDLIMLISSSIFVKDNLYRFSILYNLLLQFASWIILLAFMLYFLLPLHLLETSQPLQTTLHRLFSVLRILLAGHQFSPTPYTGYIKTFDTLSDFSIQLLILSCFLFVIIDLFSDHTLLKNPLFFSLSTNYCKSALPSGYIFRLIIIDSVF